MAKKIAPMFGLLILAALLTGVLTAAAPGPVPNVTFTLVSGLPSVMNVGETATVIVQVDSDQEFLFAQVLPTFYFPGRGVMATDMGGDRVQNNEHATLKITFVAKGSTTDFPNEGACPTGGVAPIAFVAGVRYPGGAVVSQRFPATGFYCVTVP